MDRSQLETFVVTHSTAVAGNRKWKRESVDRGLSIGWRSSCSSAAMGRRKPWVRLLIVAMLGLIFSSDGRTGVGRVEASVESSSGRSVVYGGGREGGRGGGRGSGREGGGHPSVWRWRRTMRTTIPDDQATSIMNFLVGVGGGGGGGSSIKNPSQMRRWGSGEGNPLLFLGQDGQPPSASQFLQSDTLQDERRNSDAFGNTHHRPTSAFFDSPQSFWNLDGPPRRHRSLTRNPESRSSYLALDENPYSSFRDAGGERQLMSIGARRILVHPGEGEAWRRPTQTFWRRLRSVNDKSQIDNYLLNAKRQPPPGFHAIRGKRESESNGEGRREQEEDEEEEEEEEEEEAEAEELKRWMMQKLSERVRHEML